MTVVQMKTHSGVATFVGTGAVDGFFDAPISADSYAVWFIAADRTEPGTDLSFIDTMVQIERPYNLTQDDLLYAAFVWDPALDPVTDLTEFGFFLGGTSSPPTSVPWVSIGLEVSGDCPRTITELSARGNSNDAILGILGGLPANTGATEFMALAALNVQAGDFGAPGNFGQVGFSWSVIASDSSTTLAMEVMKAENMPASSNVGARVALPISTPWIGSSEEFQCPPSRVGINFNVRI